ncbi:MAG: tetratricopeptide repeat protein [Pyrinomonadaceae bacterium]
MDASPDLWTSAVNYWNTLREGTRDNTIGGLLVAVVVTLVAIFRNALRAGVKRIFRRTPEQLQSPTRHEVVIKVETPQPTPAPTPHTPSLPSQPEPHSTAASPEIPRHPIDFVPRRDKEDRDILNLLRGTLSPHDNRLVTLCGPGGVGKTRLAVEATRLLGEAFAQRVVWVSADGRPDFKLSTLLDSIALQFGRRDLLTLAPEVKDEQVRALVVESSTLVVLDNVETIAPDEQRLIEGWFAKAQCSALFTSRDKVAGTTPIYVPTMTRNEAEEFLNKVVAQTQDPQLFTPEVRERVYETAEANPYVMQWVVGQIDLAQEPGTVLEELKHGEGDGARRVFDRSFDLPLLGDDGRDTLLALSLFAPSATPEALAAVAGFDDAARVREAIKHLRPLWLIKGVDGNRRLAVEGLTRTLAAARLSKDPRADEFRRRFVNYFLLYAVERKEPTPENYDALEAEKENLLGAAEAAYTSAEWDSVMRMANALAKPDSGMLSVRGYWNDALMLDELAVKVARSSQNEPDIATLSHNMAVMYRIRGEFAEALRLCNESLKIKEKYGDQRGMANSTREIGIIYHQLGEFEKSKARYEKSLAIRHKLGDEEGTAIDLHHLAMIAQEQGKLEEAQRLYDKSLNIKKKFGKGLDIAITLGELGNLAYSLGDISKARYFYEESLDVTKGLRHEEYIANTFHNLGVLSEKEGNKMEAARLFREALGIFERLGSPTAEVARRSLARVEGEDS